MAFSQRLVQSAALVEGRLAGLLAAAAAGGAPERLVEAMRYAALGGGKRFRPFLVLESAGLFGTAAEIALETAAAIECVHCYSLVHDDLPAMDNDDLRRGRPTLHKAFDEWTAILAGDALLTLAFEILAAPAAQPDPAIRVELVAGLARAAGAGGMVAGQCLDLAAERLQPAAPPNALPNALPNARPNARADAQAVERLAAMKTGALMRFACEAGAILARAGAQERRALAAFGERLGLAFQIADDLLDAEGDAAAMGKAARKDTAKATLHRASGLVAARQRLEALEAEAIAALAPFGDKADGLRAAAAFAVRRDR
jgi:farnesyl diphosphate synthase